MVTRLVRFPHPALLLLAGLVVSLAHRPGQRERYGRQGGDWQDSEILGEEGGAGERGPVLGER